MAESFPDGIDAAIEAHFDAIPDDFVSAPAASPAETPSPAEAAPAVPQDKPAEVAPTASDASPSPGSTTESKDYQDFLSKNGGDPNKAARAYWDLNNRAAQLARENEELRAQRQTAASAPPADPVVQAPPPPVPEEVGRLDATMRDLNTEYQRVESQRQTYATEQAKLNREIDRITDALTADGVDFERSEQLRSKLRELKLSRNEYNQEVSRLTRESSDLVREYRTTKSEKVQAERVIRLESAREAEIKRRDDESIQRFGRRFYEHVPSIAGEGPEKVPDSLLPRFKKLAQREALLQLTAPGMDLDTQDIPAFIRKIKAEFLEDINEGHKAKSAVYAAKKDADVQVNAPDGVKAVAPVAKTSRFTSRDEVDAFLESALG